jgi:hypothetical protein
MSDLAEASKKEEPEKELPDPNGNWAIAALGQIDPRELSPYVPVRWSDFAVEERPYRTLMEEYIRSPYPLSPKILRERWTGLYEERDLKSFRETPDLRARRFTYQDEVLAESLKESKVGDIKFQQRRLDKEIVDLCALIEEVQADLDAGHEYRPAKGQNNGLGYVQTPLFVDSKVKLGNLRIALSDCIARRLGLANEVLKVTVSKEMSLEEAMGQWMAQVDPEFAALQSKLSDRAGQVAAGMLGAAQGEAELAHRRSEREYGAVIDATPLPRLEAPP